MNFKLWAGFQGFVSTLAAILTYSVFTVSTVLLNNTLPGHVGSNQ